MGCRNSSNLWCLHGAPIIRGLGIGLSIRPTTVAARAEIKPSQLSQASSINSVVRSVSSAFSVALVATLVSARTSFHSFRLAEQIAPDSLAGQTLQREAGYLVNQGMTPQSAILVAMGETVRQLQQQAYLLAMNDAFLITLGTLFITVFVVLFIIRNPRKKARTAPQSNKQGNVASGDEHAEGRSISTASAEQITVTPQEKASLEKRRKDAPMRRFMRRSVLIPPAIILAILLITGVGGYILYNNYNFYSTDDAQVTGSLATIIPPTSGTLINLDVQVGSYVSARQIIGAVQPTGPLPLQHLFAPTDGVIVQIPSTVGQLVSTTTTIAIEVDPNSVKITAYVDESAIKSIADGQAVDIHVDAYNSTVTGYISQIVGVTAGQFSLLPTTDNSSGNYTKVSQRVPVYIQLDTPPDGSLLPGMSVEVTIHLH